MRIRTMACVSLIIFLFVFVLSPGPASARTNVSNSPSWWSTCPRVTVDFKGNVHVIWVEEYGGSSGDVFYSKYDVYAKTWSSPLNLSNSQQVYSVDNRPAGIDSDPSGNIYVSYSEIINKKIKLRIYANGSWGVPIDVASFEGEGDSVRVAVDANGNIFLTWWDTAWFACYSRAYINGNWEDAKIIGGGKYPDIAVGNNVVFACWTQRNPHYQIFYAWRAKTPGASWSTGQMLAPSDLKQQVPAVEIDSNDIAHIVFTPVLTDGSRIVQYSYWTGSGFSSPQNISVATLLHYPALHERGNNIYSVWQVGGYEGGSSINYNSLISGTWGGENAIPSSTGSTYCDVAASRYQDKIHYVWDASGDIYIETFTGPGQAPAAKNDFNGDGHEDILWRYYGPGGYNAVWYLGESSSGLVNPLGFAMEKPGEAYRMGDLFKGQEPKKIYWDPGKAGRRLAEEQPQGKSQAREPGRLLGIEVGESGKRQESRDVWRIQRFGGINMADVMGSPVMKAAALTVLYGQYLESMADTNWEIVGTGDFNGDGKVDILWRNYAAGGLNAVWYMDGATILYGQYLDSLADTNWKIVGTGDFNGDGKVDILWRNYVAGGLNAVWYMDGATILYGQYLVSLTDTDWEIVGTGDFNGDGKVDVLWRNYAAGGLNAVVYMDGATVIGGEYLPSLPDINWKIENH